MIEQEIFYVSVVPPQVLEANLVNEAASIINKDLYGTRLLLSGKIPRIIAHFNNMETAEFTAQRLRNLGLKVIVCKDSEVRKPQNSFRAHTLKLEQDPVLFWNTGGQSITIEPKNAFLILSGRIQFSTNTESTETKTKLNLGATLLTGGTPIWSKVTEKTGETSVQTEYFVRLYDHQSSEPIVEIVHNDFDYSFLGEKKSLSSLANFKSLVTNIKLAFPKAIFDERLTELFGLDISYSTPWENVNINSKLIHLHYQAVSNSASSI